MLVSRFGSITLARIFVHTYDHINVHKSPEKTTNNVRKTDAFCLLDVDIQVSKREVQMKCQQTQITTCASARFLIVPKIL